MLKCNPYLLLVKTLTVIATLLLPCAVFAASAGAPHLDGAALSSLWVLPFVCMLLSIAVLPLVAPHFWHSHFGKISLFWALCFLIPFTLKFGFSLALYETLHALLLEYVPFIILLLALFTVAGGVRLTGTLVGTPIVNTLLLLIGTALASWMGTTGAAMLLIRPLLRANAHRKYKVHSVVFFIFLVANIGGSLTPLGDPPLFLGFLQGVDFFWTTSHMLLPMLVAASILTIVYFFIDTYLFNKEGRPAPENVDASSSEKLGLEGKVNLLLLLGVIGAVLLSGMWHPNIEFNVYYVHVELQNLVRDLLLLCITGLSLKLTSDESRRLNDFNWFPIIEVGKLFIGIFLSMIPAIAILKAGENGALASVINMVTSNGEPVNVMYFWLTGILSSFLDNAPTYLVFFNTAGGDAAHLMGDMASTLLAISAGAVFMGANTYIGNAPNFMVRAIAEDQGVKMPSFFGYMAWSFGILIPTFILITVIFIS
ncbi:sodium:proton antiporter [Halodesulfovibrio spirochaetisodalis]|uniref:Sodium:proton antiporter n=1 Tax=Halodesulfovibrio spirochaetisodalis TaxID=1560234 RepID=A0A1B7XFF6_9BACT|nr:sodium:proton antiporter [Halodesulfovibrio spirochaetisodalis]OBQ54011.1 sodium:proton antiporter [Halodesulfovibrio spirochaetisodalis]